MSDIIFTPIDQLCIYYEIDVSFFYELDESGLIEIITVNQTKCIQQNELANLEKVIRMKNELGVNLDGIEIILNLLRKVEHLQNELSAAHNRLSLFENE